MFIANEASESGGTYYYSDYLPIFFNNSFTNNSAPYGQNIGSYPILVNINGTISN